MLPTRQNPGYLCISGAVVLLLLLPGCVSVAKQVSTDEVARIEVGKSTREDVLQVFGLPNAREVRRDEAGRKLELWTYYRTPGRSTIALAGLFGSLIPISRLEESKDPVVVLVFSESGLVVDIRTGGQ